MEMVLAIVARLLPAPRTTTNGIRAAKTTTLSQTLHSSANISASSTEQSTSSPFCTSSDTNTTVGGGGGGRKGRRGRRGGEGGGMEGEEGRRGRAIVAIARIDQHSIMLHYNVQCCTKYVLHIVVHAF